MLIANHGPDRVHPERLRRAHCLLAALTATTTLLLATPVMAQSPGDRTYSNPIDIDYKYSFEQLIEGISYRSGADPVIVNHKGEYFLFVTVSGGYWHSKDLLNWTCSTATRGGWNPDSSFRFRELRFPGPSRMSPVFPQD